MKKAIIYLRQKKLYMHASSKTVAGVWILDGSVVCLEVLDSSLIGVQLKKTLLGSRGSISHPSEWKGIFDPILKLAAIKSWGVFVKSTKCVQIEMTSKEIEIFPTKNLGASQGFLKMDERRRKISEKAGDFEIGNEVLLALNDSE